MKLLLYVIVGFLVFIAAVFLINGGQAIDRSPTILFVFLILFGIPPIGAFWMMYMSIRHEKNPLPMVFLSFIPFTFVWYYFERVRRGTLNRR